MRPIAIVHRNSRALSAALHAVQGGYADNRISLMRLFSCAEQFEARLRSYKLQREYRVGAVGVIYGPARGRSSPTAGQTCTHALLERKRRAWFLAGVERLPAVCGCHLRLTVEQAERILEKSEPGRVVLRAFDELRATVEWQPLTEQNHQQAVASIGALGATDPVVYSSLMTLGVGTPQATWAFFRAVAHAAAKRKVMAALEEARRQKPRGCV